MESSASFRKLFLPFSVESPERVEKFSDDMEVAVMSVLAYDGIKKGFFGRKKEKVDFVMKLFYPIWLLPLRKGSLVIDGLNIHGKIFVKRRMPDVEGILEELHSADSYRTFYEVLVKKLHELEGEKRVEKYSMDGTIPDKEVVQGITDLLVRGRGEAEGTPLEPRIKEEELMDLLRTFNKLSRGVEREIYLLERFTSELQRLEREFLRKISLDIDEVRDHYDAKIASLKPKVEKRVARLIRERNEKIEEVSGQYEKKLSELEKEKESILIKIQQLREEKDNLKHSLKATQDKAQKRHMKRKIRQINKLISEENKKLSAIEKRIEAVLKKRDATLDEIKKEYDQLIDEEQKELRDLMASRDAEVKRLTKLSDEIRKLVNEMSKRISEMMNEKRGEQEELGSMITEYHVDDIMCVYLPCYVIRYMRGRERRYVVYPPVRVESPSKITVKLKKTFKIGIAGKVSSSISRLSKGLENFLKVFEEELNKGGSIEIEVCSKARKNALNASREFLSKVEKGLKRLCEEGWITEQEVQKALSIIK